MIKAGNAPPTTAPIGIFNPRGQKNRNLAPGFYYHTSSKEPIAVVKNINMESPEKDQFKGPKRLKTRPLDQTQVISAERTTKAGTAIPSTRLGVSQNVSVSLPP